MNKGVKTTLWVLVFLIPLAMVLYPKIRDRDKGSAPASAKKAEGPLPVEIYRVHPERLEEKIQVQGSVMAAEEAELRSEMAGMITEILFEEGKPVTKGTELVKIDDKELQAEKSRLTYEHNLAQETENRFRQLLGQGSVSQEQYDQALNRVNTLKAQLQVVSARLEKSVILAPFDGIVGFRNVSQGSYITSNTRVATIHKIDTLKIQFAVPEKYSGMVGPGNHISFSLTGRDQTYSGEVYAVEPRIDTVTRTLPLRATAANPDGLILPGSFATVELVLQEVQHALMVPTEALVPSLGGQRVFVARDGVAIAREVSVGIRNNLSIQILSGLEEGDLVIRTGLLQVRDQLPIRITNSDQPVDGGSQ